MMGIMDSDQVIQRLVEIARQPQVDADAWRSLLRAHLNDDILAKLGQERLRWLRADASLCLRLAELTLSLSEVQARPLWQAYALRHRGHAHRVLGDFVAAEADLRQASRLYAQGGNPVEAASVQGIGLTNVLMHLGRHEEARQGLAQARAVLAAHGARQDLAMTYHNEAIVCKREGRFREALALYDRAAAIYAEQSGNEALLAGLKLNRANIYGHYLGDFERASQLFAEARTELEIRGEVAEAAKAEGNLGLVRLWQGRYHEALAHLDHAYQVLTACNMARDAAWVDLHRIVCWRELGQWDRALQLCDQAGEAFRSFNGRFELALIDVHRAEVLLRQGNFAAAQETLERALESFRLAELPLWAAWTEVTESALACARNRFDQALSLAIHARDETQAHEMRLVWANAQLLIAQSSIELNRVGLAQEALAALAPFVADGTLPPAMTARYHHWRARTAEQTGDANSARESYRQAVEEVERLRQRLIVALRPDFLLDKLAPFADAVRFHLAEGNWDAAFAYAERAKSRALVDLLAHNLDIRLRARRPEDEPLLHRLEAVRKRLWNYYRLLDTDRTLEQDEAALAEGDERCQAWREAAQELEQEIDQILLELQEHNAAYLNDVALLQATLPPTPEPYLDAGTLLISYYVTQGQIVLFAVDRDGVQFASNLGAVKVLEEAEDGGLGLFDRHRLEMMILGDGIQEAMRGLYELLLAPLTDRLAAYSSLLFVPHGMLHYVPFHALYDGYRFLVETHQVFTCPT
ncbi:MAG TPA: tetratricopeptide repeat protein, partial [Anaerolineae bacterium]|nr:tetratricopeptide repeat protein [Anaerolineae bacterium]